MPRTDRTDGTLAAEASAQQEGLPGWPSRRTEGGAGRASDAAMSETAAVLSRRITGGSS